MTGIAVPYVVDEPERCRFRVNRLSMTSGDVWETERSAIFDRCWLYVGHTSELPEKNDVRARTVGGRPLLLCRDDTGETRVFLNSCTHRGTTLCREQATHGRFLRCFFHAWTFDTSGALVSLPDEEGYGPAFAREEHHLVSPPHVATTASCSSRSILTLSRSSTISTALASISTYSSSMALAPDSR